MKNDSISTVEVGGEPSITQSLHYYDALLSELSKLCRQITHITTSLSNKEQPESDESFKVNDGSITSFLRRSNDELNHRISFMYANVRIIQEVLGIDNVTSS